MPQDVPSIAALASDDAKMASYNEEAENSAARYGGDLCPMVEIQLDCDHPLSDLSQRKARRYHGSTKLTKLIHWADVCTGETIWMSDYLRV